MCTGSNISWVCWKMAINELRPELECKDSYCCELDEKKAKISTGSSHNFDRTESQGSDVEKPCCFKNIEHMHSGEAWCWTHGKRCSIPTGRRGPLANTAGTSCKSVSGSNPFRAEFENAIEEKKGSTGITFDGYTGALISHASPISLFENVDDVAEGTKANMDAVMNRFQESGYKSSCRVHNGAEFYLPVVPR